VKLKNVDIYQQFVWMLSAFFTVSFCDGKKVQYVSDVVLALFLLGIKSLKTFEVSQ